MDRSNDLDYKVYIYAQNSNYPDDRNLDCPLFFVVFNVIRKFTCDNYSGNSSPRRRSFIDINTSHEFHHPFSCLAQPGGESHALFSSIINDIGIPFPLVDCFWKNPLCFPSHLMNKDEGVNGTRLADQVRGIVPRISEVAAEMIRVGSGWKKLRMLVTIEKRCSVSPAYMDYLHLRSRNLDMESYRRWASRVRAGPVGSDWAFLDMALRESAEAYQIRSQPASKPSVDGLEKLIYEGSSSSSSANNGGKNDALNCVVCMEVVLSGSQLTRMPCSHFFHSDCITKWLKASSFCPLCRFKLPTDYV